MNNKFDFGAAEQLCELLVGVADAMENENQRVQNSFAILHETFRDQAYEEFQSDFDAADKTMARIILDLREIRKALMEYSTRLKESV